MQLNKISLPSRQQVKLSGKIEHIISPCNNTFWQVMWPDFSLLLILNFKFKMEERKPEVMDKGNEKIHYMAKKR